MTITCGCWRCRGYAHNDGTLHAPAAILPGRVWMDTTTTWNPDPLRPPETDTDPPPRPRRRPGHCPHGAPLGRCWCPGPECSVPHDDEDRGVWAGVALMLTVALVALVVGVLIGRLS